MEIAEHIRLHKLWLDSDPNGKRLDLSGANLSGTNFSGADLSMTNFSGADLSGTNFSGANFSGADLSGTNLSGADLSMTNLSGADFSGADFFGADLNWGSHDLLSAVLFREAGDDIAKRKIAGLILVSRDWCWSKFLLVDDPLKAWAISVFSKYVNEKTPKEVSLYLNVK